MSNTELINPIMLSIPEHFDTARLTIRAPEWGDGAEVNEAIRESVEQLRPWLPFAEKVPSLEESEAHVRKAKLQFWSGQISFFICEISRPMIL